MKFSIIVPVYNSELYLRKCLDSLVNQTIDSIEIIVVNDGSTDKSDAIIKEYSHKYNNIIYITQKNRGQAHARNVGVSHATGKYLSFVDSDDYVDENMYENLLIELDKTNADIAVFGFHQLENESDTLIKGFPSYNESRNKRYVVSDAGPWNKVYERRMWIENNIKFLEGKIYEDLAVIPSLACYTNNISFIEINPYYYIIHSSSTMRQNEYNSKLQDIFYSIDYLKITFFKNNKYNEYKEEIEYIYIYNLLHGATLRFLNYEEGLKDIKKINKIMKLEYPHWIKNKYFKQQGLKYKIICVLIYLNKIKLVKRLLRK